MSGNISVLVILATGRKVWYHNAHIAGIRDGRLLIDQGRPKGSGMDTEADAVIELREISAVELVARDDDTGTQERISW